MSLPVAPLTEAEYQRLNGKLKAAGAKLEKSATSMRRPSRDIVPVDEQAKALLEQVKKRIKGGQ